MDKSEEMELKYSLTIGLHEVPIEDIAGQNFHPSIIRTAPCDRTKEFVKQIPSLYHGLLLNQSVLHCICAKILCSQHV